MMRNQMEGKTVSLYIKTDAGNHIQPKPNGDRFMNAEHIWRFGGLLAGAEIRSAMSWRPGKNSYGVIDSATLVWRSARPLCARS